MTGLSALAWLLAGLSALVYPDRPTIRRVADLSRGSAMAAGPRIGGASAVPGVRAIRLSPAVRRAAIAVLGVAALGVLVALPWWSVAAAMIPVGVVTARIPVRATPAQRLAERQLLAVHADLLAACLDSGMAIGPALHAVSGQLAAAARGDHLDVDPRANPAVGSDPPSGALQALNSVATMLALGAGPDLSWQPAAPFPELAGLAASARRSAAGGIAMADAVREHAAGLRATNAGEAERKAARAGVAATAPLGLCFLPAFLCLGLAPVVVGLLGTLGIF